MVSIRKKLAFQLTISHTKVSINFEYVLAI
jgi:hypothetical protein